MLLFCCRLIKTSTLKNLNFAKFKNMFNLEIMKNLILACFFSNTRNGKIPLFWTTRETVVHEVTLQNSPNACEEFTKSSRRRKAFYLVLFLLTVLCLVQAFSLQQRFTHPLIDIIARENIFGQLLMQKIAGNFFIIALSLAPLPLFYVSFNALLFTQVQTQVMWPFLYSMLIEGSANFWQLNRKRFNVQQSTQRLHVNTEEISLRKFITEKLKDKIKLFINFCENAIFFSPYHHRPFVSKRLRTQMFIISITVDKFEKLCMSFYGKRFCKLKLWHTKNTYFLLFKALFCSTTLFVWQLKWAHATTQF